MPSGKTSKTRKTVRSKATSTDPMNPADITAVEELDRWKEESVQLALLGQKLVPSDSHDEKFEGHEPLMTEDKSLYFVPCDGGPPTGFPVGRIGRLGSPRRTVWQIEAVHVTPATRDEPEDHDLVRIGEAASLREAMLRARILEETRKLRESIMAVDETYWMHLERIQPPDWR